MQNPAPQDGGGFDGSLLFHPIALVHVGAMSLAATLQSLIHAGNDMYVLHLHDLACGFLTDFTPTVSPLRLAINCEFIGTRASD